MGNRDYYLDPENEHIRRGYKEYLGRIFRFAGIPEADVEKAVAGVMNVETKLAEKSWSNVELRNIPAQYNPTAKADFEKTYDAVDWEAYYKAMGIGDFEHDHRHHAVGRRQRQRPAEKRPAGGYPLLPRGAVHRRSRHPT